MLNNLRRLAPHRIAAAVVMLGLVVFAIIQSLRPLSVTIEAGLNAGKGSYYDTAAKYKKILESHGVHVVLRENPDTVRIISNVDRDDGGADIGFTIQASQDEPFPNVGAAGISELQPLFIFTNAALGEVTSLTQLRGKRVATLKPGSITNTTTLRVLRQFDVTPENATFVYLEKPADLVNALVNNRADAVFLIVGPSNAFISQLMNAPNARPFDMTDAMAIARNVGFLRVAMLPRGSFDMRGMVPTKSLMMLAGPVEVIMRQDINPAVAYLLLDAMKEVHHGTTVISDAGAFPVLKETNVAPHPITEAYAKAGVPWIYHHLPPRLASVIDQYGVIGIVLVLLRNVLAYLKMIDGILEKGLGGIGRSMQFGHRRTETDGDAAAVDLATTR